MRQAMYLPMRTSALVGAVLLGLVSIAVAHGDDEDMGMNMGVPETTNPTVATSANTTAPSTYFNYGEHSGLMFTHILLMTIGWVFVLPIGEFTTTIRGLSHLLSGWYRCYVLNSSITLCPPHAVPLCCSECGWSIPSYNLQRQYSRPIPQ